MKSLQNAGRRLRSIGLFYIAIFMLGFGATTASSAPPGLNLWVFSDSFENSPESTWGFTGEGYGIGIFGTNIGTFAYSKTGVKGAYIMARPGAWKAVGRFVDIKAFKPGLLVHAMAQIYVRPLSRPVHMAVAVIDPDTWTYISVKEVVLSTSAWEAITTDLFTVTKRVVYVRISIAPAYNDIFERSAVVDDLGVIAFY